MDPAGMLNPLADNPKSKLNTFCQRKTQKTISKEDVVYTCQKFEGSGHQATVTLVCMGGVQFAGQVGATAKEAEQHAASAALEHYADEVATLPAATKGKKRKATDDGTGMPAVPSPNVPGAVTNKSLLNQAISRCVKRPLTKEDLSCSSIDVGGGFQCTLSMPGMPGEWGSQAWAGEVTSKKSAAEESAATFAYAALIADPMYGPIIAAPAQPKVNNYKGGGGGKGKSFGGKGKGKGKGKWDMGMGMGMGGFAPQGFGSWGQF